MDIATYTKLDGIGLAECLSSGEVSSLDLHELAFGLASAVNEKLNFLVFPKFDEALERCRSAALRGPFGAIPFLLKDSGLASTFLPSSVGSNLFGAMQSKINSTLVERFEEAGLLSFGRTTVPEFCMAPTSEATYYGGPTLNPWNPEHSAGGSSGGAAVAVATGVIPIAHGSDGGGSIRIPASCCGVYGLKASRGLIPFGPLRGEAWGGLATDGVLTRSVRDTAAAFDVIAGMEIGAPYAAPARPDSYYALLDNPFPRPLRIAHWTEAWEGIEIADECMAATQFARGLLEKLGHEVVDVPPPPIKFGRFLDAMIDVMAAGVTQTVNGMLRHQPNLELDKVLEPAIHDAWRRGAEVSAETYGLAINRFHAIGRRFEMYMRDYDYVLTPTLVQPPAKLGEISMNSDFLSFRRKTGAYTTFLAVINASGQPAASLPLYQSDAGLPIGVQLIGRFGDEAGLLRLSARLERLSPWKNRLVKLD